MKFNAHITVPIGEGKMTYWPANKTNENKTSSFVIFVKKNGTYEEDFPETVDKLLETSIPVVSLHFKSKRSINKLIKMLKHFRDEEYGQVDKE